MPKTSLNAVKLSKESHVIFREKADILNAMTKHNKPFYPHPPSVSLIFFRVYPYIAKNLGVNHAGPTNLKPS
jgi:hypothetical protein